MNDEKEYDKIIRKKVFENIIISIAVMLYFIVINFACIRLKNEIVVKILRYFSLGVITLAIIIFEAAYKKDSGKIAIHGIEISILAIITLTINNIINKYNYEMKSYILFLSYMFSIYYVLKSILIYTNEKRKYLKSLSDIHEIISKNPTKKEAKRRNII